MCTWWALCRYKHLRVSDFSDSTATLPLEDIQQFFPVNGAAPALPTNIMFDPDLQGKQLKDRKLLMFRIFYCFDFLLQFSIRLTYIACDSLVSTGILEIMHEMHE